MKSMNHLKILTLCTALVGTPALADEFADRIVVWLQDQGFTEFEVKRTWLGRIKIEAYADGIEREIIVNGRTGEILRDFWELEGDGGDTPLLLQIPEGLGNDRGISPVQSVEDDGDDHDDDADDDDDSDEDDADEDEDDEDEDDD